MKLHSSFVALCGLAVLAGCGAASVGRTGSANSSQVASMGQAVTGGICPAGPTVLGIDVSSWQGSVNWGAVAGAGVKFAIARVSDGTGFVDPTFRGNWAGMKNAGLLRGAYQFFEPNQDAIAQANLVIGAVGRLGPGDLPVMLDMEVADGQSPGTIASKIQQWVNAITAGTGKVPYIYTGAYFWDGNVGTSAFNNLALDVAWYGTNCPGVPNAWANKGWTLHQYTDRLYVAGVNGGVDADVFNGTLAQLQAWAGASVPGPTTGATNASGSAYVFGQQQQHVFERGSDGTLHHWFWDANANRVFADSWGGNLTGQATGFVFGLQQHVFGRGNDGHLHHWFYDANANKVFSDDWGGDLAGDPTSYVFGLQQHAFGRGSDGTLHHWFYDANTNRVYSDGWGGNLTGQPTGFTFGVQQHVFGRGSDGHLHHWFYDANANRVFADDWGGDLAGDPTSFVDGLQQHVFGRGSDGHLHHWFWDANANRVFADDWGGQLVGNPMGYVAAQQQHVFAQGADGQLHHWFYDPIVNRVTADVWGGSLTARPSGFVDGPQQHAFGRGADGQLHHWFWDPNANRITTDVWGGDVAAN